jgi:hypothetical protein
VLIPTPIGSMRRRQDHRPRVEILDFRTGNRLSIIHEGEDGAATMCGSAVAVRRART